MSLEQALMANTIAILELTALIKSATFTAPEKEKKAKPAAEPVAATEPAVTQATAEPAAVPEVKAAPSVAKEPLTLEARATYIKEVVAKFGRDKMAALLAEFGATKASEIAAPDTLAAFDAKLVEVAGA